MADVRAPLRALLCLGLLLGPQAGTALAAPKPKPTASPGSSAPPKNGKGHVKKAATPAPPAAPTSAPAPVRSPAPAVAPVRTPVRPVPGRGGSPGAGAPAPGPAAPAATTPPRPSRPVAPVVEEPTKPAGVAPVARALTGIATNDPQLPLGIVLVVVTFLLVQSRIDRKDPKLAETAKDDLVFNLPRRPQEVIAVPRHAATVVRVAVAPDPTSLP